MPCRRTDMDQLAIDVIEGFLGVPLIAPERIHDLDAKEIAAALDRIDDERLAALGDTEDAWEKPIDETNVERLEEIMILIREAIANCEACEDGHTCQPCLSFKAWLAEA